VRTNAFGLGRSQEDERVFVLRQFTEAEFAFCDETPEAKHQAIVIVPEICIEKMEIYMTLQHNR
jgi:hypothetical protein